MRVSVLNAPTGCLLRLRFYWVSVHVHNDDCFYYTMRLRDHVVVTKIVISRTFNVQCPSFKCVQKYLILIRLAPLWSSREQKIITQNYNLWRHSQPPDSWNVRKPLGKTLFLLETHTLVRLKYVCTSIITHDDDRKDSRSTAHHVYSSHVIRIIIILVEIHFSNFIIFPFANP